MHFNNWVSILKNFGFPCSSNRSPERPPKKGSGGKQDFSA